MRVMLFTGKGGVGKTTIAAATALAAARRGYRTLVLSTDPAHSLGDSFNLGLGNEPQRIAPGLEAAELNVLAEIEKSWGAVREKLASALVSHGIDQVLAEEIAILPGMDEVFALLRVRREYARPDLDLIILDGAPTGNALRLLALPEAGEWYAGRLSGLFHLLSGRALPILGPLLERLAGIKAKPAAEALERKQREFFQGLRQVRSVVADPGITSVRLVVNPERMVIAESKRAYTALGLYGLTTDMVVINRVLPEDVADPYFAHWRQTQARYLQEIAEAFAPLPMPQLPLRREEVVGLEALQDVAEQLYGSSDPVPPRITEPLVSYSKTEAGYELSLRMPFVKKGEVQLSMKGDELHIRLGNHRRTLALPQALWGFQPRGASLLADRLVVRFARP